MCRCAGTRHPPPPLPLLCIVSYGDPYHLLVTQLQLFAVLAVDGAVPPHGGTGVLLGVLGAAMEIFTTLKLLMPPVIRIPAGTSVAAHQ